MQNRQQIPHDINDDLKFLIACCQTKSSKDDINFIISYLSQVTHYQCPDRKCPWGALITTASQHGILPLVYKTIKQIVSRHPELLELNSDTPVSKEQEGCVSGSNESQSSSLSPQHLTLNTLFSNLKTSYIQIAQRNILMSAELLKIMRLLEKNQIEALAFKGPALAQMAYGDITLRQYSDLDILVDEDDAFKAGKLMSENGHKAILPLTILSNKTCLHTAKDFSLMSKSGGVHTELHWRLFEKKYNISLLSCAVDKKCQTVSINNKEIKTLQNELLLVYLCLHGAKHAFERIEWICDIDRLIRSSEVNWEEAISIANQSHSKRSFYLGLSLAHHLFHTPLPSETQKNINADDIQMLHVMTLKQMTEKNSERSDFKRNRDTFFYQAKLFDQKRDMLRFYLSTFFKISTTDCQTFTLPENLKFLYIILRPIRLTWNYTQKIFKK